MKGVDLYTVDELCEQIELEVGEILKEYPPGQPEFASRRSVAAAERASAS